ncbi:MAG: hypothetical protein RRY35_03160 [Clostridiales bacterium]
MTLIPLFDLESYAEIETLKQALAEHHIPYQISDNIENMRGMTYGHNCIFLFPPRVWGQIEDAEKIEALLAQIRAALPPQEQPKPAEGQLPENQIRTPKKPPEVLE